MMKFLYFLTLLIVLVKAKLRLDPLVQTSSGLMRGLNANDGDYSMFLGVPYAQVNQSNVFGDAIPISKFDETFEAYDDTSMCPQVEDTNNTISGTLDCLHLNIYVPNIAATKTPLPVMIWIHGGYLYKGHAGRYRYGPKFLVSHDIILVTINYRLGPYGFMCLDIPEVPGNQGLKDQYLAIKWIKENIKEFGGDPDQITLAGHSAGSKCVEAHLLSNRETMFNKVIMQSGSVLGPNVLDLPDKDALKKLSSYLGFASDDIDAQIEFLSDSSTDLVIKASSELNLNFYMCVEKRFDGVDHFMYEHPEHASYVKTKNMPILIGFTSKERMIESKKVGIFEDPKYIEQQLKGLFSLEESEEMIDVVRRSVRHFYIGDEPNGDMETELIDLISDFIYNYPIQRSVELFLKSDANVYQYFFSYDGERNMVKKESNLTLAGAAHADELAFLFDLSYDKVINDNDQIIVDTITEYWTNFVKHGDPNSESTELLRWREATNDKLYYIDIDSVLSTGTRPFNRRLTFWKLFFKHNEKNHRAHKYFSNL